MKALAATINICFALLFCANVRAFPADAEVTQQLARKDLPESERAEAKESNNSSSHSLSTTSSLLFKDTKPILTYLLGQPHSQESISSPAQLLSPDRYEFFTFDDDGQIVKKLMSVKEIQKIIANNERGTVGDQGTPIEYYQILTVTPDVESIPSVSRINPNEPLFSIHDVIASVQNVLKSEMKTKLGSEAKFNGTNYNSAASDHFEILTEKPEASYGVHLTPETSPESGVHQGSEEKTSGSMEEMIKLATQSMTTQVPEAEESVAVKTTTPTPLGTIFLEKLTDTAKPWVSSIYPGTPLAQTESSALKSSMPDVTSFREPEESSSSSSSLAQDPLAEAARVPPELPLETVPLSILDAHPGFFSNESFLDMQPFSVENSWRIEDPSSDETTAQNSTGTVKVEDVGSVFFQNSDPTNLPNLETSTTVDQVPFTQDIANSVSSVLWQIASENALLNTQKSTDAPFSSNTKSQITETSESKDDPASGSMASDSTTEVFVQNRNAVKADAKPNNPILVLESILRPQNKPRPFQVATPVEKEVPDILEVRTEPLSSAITELEEKLYSSPSSSVVVLPETDSTEGKETPSSTLKPAVEVSTSTIPPPSTFIISLSPDAVAQSPENLKPTEIDKIVASEVKNETDQTIEGVQVVQEANIGQIPRTTEYPGQVVKEILKSELGDGETDESSSTTLRPLSVESTTSFQTTTGTQQRVAEENDGEGVQYSTPAATEVTEGHKNLLPTQNSEATFVPVNLPAGTKEDAAGSEAMASEQVDVVKVSASESISPILAGHDNVESKEATESSAEVKTGSPATASPSSSAPSEASTVTATTPVRTTHVTTTSAPTTMTTTQKTSSAALTEPSATKTNASQDEDEMGSFKQNTPVKQKPQKHVFGKPVKAKPQADSKPTKPLSPGKPFSREPAKEPETKKPYENHLQSSPTVLELDAAPDENLGLEATVANLDDDIKQFSDLCNDLAFSLWSSITHNGLSFVRSVVVSPFAVTSLLAMVFLGARGPTSGQMNDVLRLDDMVTFNPHLVFRNVTESLVISRNSGVATAAFVRELYSDKSKGKLLDFYKERVQQFYDGHVEEVNFKTIGDTLRRQTNHLVKRQTWGKITDFLRGSNLMPRPPLAAFSANIFQTDCSRASTKDRDGEMYFVILPASRLRRLVPIPAVVWRSGFLAGYEPQLDATAVAINPNNSPVSTIFVLPGQQGLIAPGDTLARLEHHLLGSSYKKGHWSRLMRSLLPRPGLELQIPRMSHKSVINVTSSLQRMGLKDLFSAEKADLTGLNGLANDLHLSDMLQVNLFSTCGEEPIGARHHSEIYPATPILRREKSIDGVLSESIDSLFAVSDFENPAISALPLELRPRQARIPLSKPGARIPEPPRLRFDRPFLYFVRHNPTGLILHMGRFNPRLMP